MSDGTERRTVTTTDAPAPVGPYSQAVIAGGFVFCSGQIALDPSTGEIGAGDVADETCRVMDNLAAVLAAAGSGLDRVVLTTIYVTYMGDFAAVNDAYGAYFKGGAPPARATVEVTALPKGARVEISCIACAGD